MLRTLLSLYLLLLLSWAVAQVQERYYFSAKKIFTLGYSFSTEQNDPIVQEAKKKDFESVHGFHLEIGYGSKEKVFFGFVVRHVNARNMQRFAWGEMYQVDIKDYFTGLSANYPIGLKNTKLFITPNIELGLLNPHYITTTGSTGRVEREYGSQLVRYTIGTDLFYKVYKYFQLTAGASYSDKLTSFLFSKEVYRRSKIFQISTGIRVSI